MANSIQYLRSMGAAAYEGALPPLASGLGLGVALLHAALALVAQHRAEMD